jgi:DNA polymerase IV
MQRLRATSGGIRAAPRRIAEVRTRSRAAAKHPFETHTHSRTLAAPTAEDRVVFDTAWDLSRADTHAGRAARLIGLSLSARAQSTVQPDLFADMDAREGNHADDRLDATLDAIRRRFAWHCIQHGLLRRP